MSYLIYSFFLSPYFILLHVLPHLLFLSFFLPILSRVLFSYCIFSHLIQDLFGELARVLKSNGMLTIVTDNLWYAHLSVSVNDCLSVSVCLSVCSFICLSICLSICLCVCQPIYQMPKNIYDFHIIILTNQIVIRNCLIFFFFYCLTVSSFVSVLTFLSFPYL